MIKQEDLEEAIAECQGVIKPSANTCLKLASFFVIRDHMFGNQTEEVHEMPYSFSSGDVIDMTSNSEFANVINGKHVDSVLDIIDELMNTLQILNQRLYNSVIIKLKEAD